MKAYMTGKEMAGFLRTVTEATQEAPVQMLRLWLIVGKGFYLVLMLSGTDVVTHILDYLIM